MLARRLTSVFNSRLHTSAVRMAEEASASGAAATKVNLNLASPSASFYENTPVDLVVIPGLVGEYGVTAGHTPLIAQMKPGVIQVHHEREKNVEKFFTAGGFAFTHANSTTDLACVELVKLEDIDEAEAKAGLEKEKTAMDAAQEGSIEKTEARIAYEAYQAMLNAVAAGGAN